MPGLKLREIVDKCVVKLPPITGLAAMRVSIVRVFILILGFPLLMGDASAYAKVPHSIGRIISPWMPSFFPCELTLQKPTSGEVALRGRSLTKSGQFFS